MQTGNQPVIFDEGPCLAAATYQHRIRLGSELQTLLRLYADAIHRLHVGRRAANLGLQPVVARTVDDIQGNEGIDLVEPVECQYRNALHGTPFLP